MSGAGTSYRSISAARARAEQKTRRPPLLLPIDGTDGRTFDRFKILTAYYTDRVILQLLILSSVGGRAFSVAGPTIWNSLPDNVISAPSLSIFRQRLKTFLFHTSFRDIIIDPR